MPQRISYLVQDQPAIYGAERALLDLLDTLRAKSDLELKVLLIRETRMGREAGEFGKALHSSGLDIQELFVSGAFSRALLRALREASGNTDVIHAIGPKADLHLALCRPTCKTVSTLHGWLFPKEWKERLHEWLDAWSLRRMDAVIVLSRFYEAQLRQRRIDPVRIPTGFDLESVSHIRRSHEKNRKRVGILGRLSSEKNHIQLLEALVKLSEVSCWIAGSGPDEASLRQAVARLGLEDRVEFLGFVPREEVLAQIDVLVLCSVVENLPYTIMEAMALHIPVVATDVGGHPDLIRHEETGCLVPPGDASALARGIEAALGDTGAQTQAAYAHLQEAFSPEGCAASHVALYEEVCSG